MKSPVQRMLAQRRLALVTERTPLQPGNFSEDPETLHWVGWVFAAVGSCDVSAYFGREWPLMWCDEAQPIPAAPAKREMTATEVLFGSAPRRMAAPVLAGEALFRAMLANLGRTTPRPQWLAGEWT